MCHQKHSSLCWSVFSCIPSEESNRAVRRSAQKQSSGLFFSPREIPACVTRNTPAYAGVFFRVSRARNRTGQCAAAHKNSPVDCFLARGRFPRVSPETLQLMLECFFVYPVQGIEPDGAQVLLCAIMERCVFGCILDMKIPPELSEFFLCLL